MKLHTAQFSLFRELNESDSTILKGKITSPLKHSFSLHFSKGGISMKRSERRAFCMFWRLVLCQQRQLVFHPLSPIIMLQRNQERLGRTLKQEVHISLFYFYWKPDLQSPCRFSSGWRSSFSSDLFFWAEQWGTFVTRGLMTSCPVRSCLFRPSSAFASGCHQCLQQNGDTLQFSSSVCSFPRSQLSSCDIFYTWSIFLNRSFVLFFIFLNQSFEQPWMQAKTCDYNPSAGRLNLHIWMSLCSFRKLSPSPECSLTRF